MRGVWKLKPLGEVCNFIGGGTPSKANAAFYVGDIPWATVRDMTAEVLSHTEFKISKQAVIQSSTNVIPGNNVIIATRVGLGKVCMLAQDTAINQDLRGIIPKDSRVLDARFLFRWFQSVVKMIAAEGTGLTVMGVKLPFVKSLKVPIPPLPEQKRIVAILDEAFEGITAAVANAEQNLVNARELFEGYLNAVFTQKSEEWVETTLGDIADFKNGLNFTKSSKGEWIKIVGVKDFLSNYWVPMDELATVQIEGVLSEAYTLQKNDILTVRSNGNKQLICRCMLADNVPEKTSHSGFNIRIRVRSSDIDLSYLLHYLKSGAVRELLVNSGGGTNINSLRQKVLSNLPVLLPKRSEQSLIVTRIEAIEAKSSRLVAIYQNKLATLAELKQSILQKAFASELTSEMKSTQLAKATKSIEVKTTSPEFTANVLAFAYHLHVANQRDKTFGHVKAQKTLHLVESIGGVDLGRTPVKDAAGPNDFQHMLRAEDWAEANQFFKFVRRGSRYDFKKLSRYKEMIAGAFATIKPYREELDRVLDLVIPMNTSKTELFATVHAAWNDLILEGGEINDKAIILAARDNWHPDKMNIPERKFREAIRKIRQKGLIPDGKAKRVGGQESLF